MSEKAGFAVAQSWSILSFLILHMEIGMKKNLLLLFCSLFFLSACGDDLFEFGEDDDDDGSPTHNAGTNCNSCHSFTYAGTIYKTGAGTTAANGVAVTINDAGGEITLTSNSTGNFYTSSGTPSSGYKVTVADGSFTQSKTGTFHNGGCNGSSCHVSGKEGRIYLESG